MKPQVKMSIVLVVVLLLLFPANALADELSAQFGGNPLVVPVGHSVDSEGLIILLSLTVVGIPLAVIIFIVGIAAIILGTLPLIEYIGHQFLSPRLLEYPALSKWFILALLLVSVFNLPLIGFIVLLSVAFTGLGVALTSGWIYLKERKRR